MTKIQKGFDVGSLGCFGGNNGENVVPRAVAVVGNTPTIPLTYNLLMNNFAESDTLTIKYPLELFDYSLLRKGLNGGARIATVELFSGFLPINMKQHTWVQSYSEMLSNEELKIYLLKNYQKHLPSRWFGYVDHPEYEYGESGDFIVLHCRELATLMQRYAFERKYESNKATVQQVLRDITSTLSVFKITLDKQIPTKKLQLLLGVDTKVKKDDTTEEVIKDYNTVGKSYWDIIQDILQKAKLQIIQDPKQPFNYLIQDLQTTNRQWTLDRAYHFNKLTMRQGTVGGGTIPRIGVIVESKQSNNQAPISVSFPRNLSNDSPESLNIRKIDAGIDKNIDYCKTLAYDFAQILSRQSLNGDMTIPNAITELRPRDILRIIDTTKTHPLRNVTQVTAQASFLITSIQESFGYNAGLRQDQVEFDLDPNINTVDDDGNFFGYKVKPQVNNEKNNSSTIEYFSITDEDNLTKDNTNDQQ